MRVDKLQACGNSAVTGSLTISGDLTVDGCVYLTNADEVQIQDDTLQLNFGGSAAGGGLEVTGTNATGSLTWDGVNQIWKAGALGSEQAILTQGGNTYKESVTGTSISITHSLNESYPSVTCWDTATNQIVIPETVTTTSANGISLTFCADFTGMVVVQR